MKSKPELLDATLYQSNSIAPANASQPLPESNNQLFSTDDTSSVLRSEKLKQEEELDIMKNYSHFFFELS